MRLDHLLSKEFVLLSRPLVLVVLWTLVGVACFWVDACRPHGAVFDTKFLQGYVGALSGVWEDTVCCLVRQPVGWCVGLVVCFSLGRWLPAGHACVVGGVSGGVV